MSIASRSSQSPVLKPGEWWLKYNGPRLCFRNQQIARGEELILKESLALHLLATVQRIRPDLVKDFIVLGREPEENPWNK